MRIEPRVNLCLASPHLFPAHGGAQLRFLRYLPGLRERNIFARVVTGTPKTQESANTLQNAARNEDEGSIRTGDVPLTELNGFPSIESASTAVPVGGVPWS